MSAPVPQSVTAELQSLSPDAIIELFELDLCPVDPSLSNSVLYFHAGANSVNAVNGATGADGATNPGQGIYGPIIWKGVPYLPYPVTISGYEYNGQGQLPRPKMQVSNVASTISALVVAYGDLVGAKVTRRRTFAKFLDAANFPDADHPEGYNPDADPTAEFPPDIYFIDQRTAENRNAVEFTLAAAFDFQGVTLPRRVVVKNVCAWTYRTWDAKNNTFDNKKPQCPYNRVTIDKTVSPSGSPFFDANDNPTTDPASDRCGKRLSSCKARFGANGVLPFGAFPASSLTTN